MQFSDCSERLCVAEVFLLLWGTVSQPRLPLRMEMMLVMNSDPPASFSQVTVTTICIVVFHLGGGESMFQDVAQTARSVNVEAER